MIDNLDLFEMHEREEERKIRRMARAEHIDRDVDKETEEKRANNEKRITSKS